MLVGRGRNYSRLKAMGEWSLARLYGGGWPAELAHALGLQQQVRVLRHRVVTRRWPAGCRPLTVAFASDLHAGPTTHPSLLDEAARILESAGADLLLLGGDYVYLSSAPIEEVVSRIGGVAAPSGRFAVLGNHDLWADDRAIVTALGRAGARVLVNEHVNLEAPFAHVAVAGLDDPWTGERAVDRALSGIAPDAFRLVLVHAPEAVALLRERPFDLAICGHTHGGHIALPGGIPIVTSGPMSRRFGHGRYDLGAGRTLIVSRGVGATEVPFRWNAEPEVLVVEIAGES